MNKDGIESNQTDTEFEEFEKAGEVEVGETDTSQPEKKSGRRGPAREPKETEKPESKDEKEDEGEGEGKQADDEETVEDEEEEEQEEKPAKKKRQPSDRIRELTRRNRDTTRLLETALARLDALENGGLPNSQGGGKSKAEDNPAPDPKDTEKYPLGHLDDRYIEDKLEWLADQKAANLADAALQRQQGDQQQQAFARQREALLEKVDDLTKAGVELFDDFEDYVVSGMRGDWDLDQPTFEAAHEAENGAQILYELAQDRKEASRVAKLSPYQQLKFVQERDAEIQKVKSGRRIPRADAPPENRAHGKSSRTQGNPATDNLDDFEKQWERASK